MKKYLFFAAALLCATAANAKVWRINYEDNAKADFKTIKEACNEAKVQDGDTLYIEPGYHKGSTSDNTISRPLTILGAGYSMQRNIGSTSPIATSNFSTHIYATVSNIKIAGITANTIYITSGTSESIKQNITIERCNVTSVQYNRYQSNITIRNNYISSSINAEYKENVNYLSIVGNVVLGNINLPKSNTSLNNLCQYNTIVCQDTYVAITSQNAIIKDNIIIHSNASKVFDFDETNEFHHNVLSIPSASANEKFPNNYYIGATVENTFVNTTDGVWYDEAMKYQLLETSAAKNASHAGDDCGAFGGAHPYVLFGRPQGVPYIYDVEVPAQPTNNQLHVTFKVARQNE